MSDIKIQPSATGSATVTLTAPVTNTARTITFPDSTSTLLASDGSAANLTAIPADATKLSLAGGTMTGNLIGTTADFFDAGNGNYPIFHVKDTADTFVALFEGNRAGDTGANVHIRHWPSSAAENNRTNLIFQMKDDGNNVTNYGIIGCFIDDNTGGTEDGNLRFSIMKNGTSTEAMRINSSGVTVTGEVITTTGELTNTPSWGVQASTNQTIATSTQTVVAYATEIWDTDNAFASNRFTVPSGKAGVYHVTVNGYMTNIDDGENFRLSIAKNGTVISTSETKWFSSASNQEMIVNAGWDIKLVVGDYIEVWTYHTEGASQSLDYRFTTFSGYRLIGV